MNFDLRILAATAGISFGAWPYLQGASGVGGTTAALWMAVVTVAVTAPMAYMGWYGSVNGNANVSLLVAGGLIQTLGIVAMAMLAQQSPTVADMSRYMALGFVINACVPVVVFFAANIGQLTKINRYDVIGLVGAVVTVYCLSRPRG